MVRAELDARIQEAKRLEAIARDGLRALMGPDAPPLDIDDEDFVPVEVKDRPVTYYEEQARFNRPEVRLLEHAVRAKHALADLERRKEYPDLVLIANGALAFASGVDDPQNAFMSHYFHSSSIGVALALRMQLDLGPKNRARVAHACRGGGERVPAQRGAGRDPARRTQGLRRARRGAEPDRGGAQGRTAGKSWISAVSQNFTLGLGEARNLSDALNAFFQMRARYLQAVFDLNVAASTLVRVTGTSDISSSPIDRARLAPAPGQAKVTAVPDGSIRHAETHNQVQFRASEFSFRRSSSSPYSKFLDDRGAERDRTVGLLSAIS